MALYLALDVGGTKSAAVLADDTKVLARTTAGSIKTLRLSSAEASVNLAGLLSVLEAEARLALRGAVVRTCVGTSGVSAPGVRAWLREAFAQRIGGEFILLGDEVIGLDGAFAGRRGVLVIAGTGSNIVGRAADGRMAHTGGWGPALADEGSGHWIGTEALRTCFRAIDAAAPSTADAVSAAGEPITVAGSDLPHLLQRILATLGLSALDDIVGVANTPGFASSTLVPVVVEAANGGDSLARAVLERAGLDLAGLITAVVNKVTAFELDLPAPLAPPPVAYVGGVLSNIAYVRQAMTNALAQQFPGIVVQARATDPLAGALWHARGRVTPDAPALAPAAQNQV